MPHEEHNPNEELEDQYTCPNCGERTEELVGEVDGESVCEACYDDATICASCENRTNDTTDISVNGRNQLWCEGCFDEYACVCGRCSLIMHGDSAFSFDGEGYCEDCYNEITSYCDDCNETVLSESVRVLTNGNVICDSCWEYGEYFCCEECDHYFHREDMSPEFDEVPICRNCAREEQQGQSESNRVHNYSYKPTLDPWVGASERPDLNSSTLFFGVETEVEILERNIDELVRTVCENSLFYCKDDSTIAHGFEVVTRPFSFSFAKQHRELWQPLFDLREHGNSYHSQTTGMHVHMSRRAFSRTHLMKFAKFFIDNSDFTYSLSRRSRDRFRRYGTTSGFDPLPHFLKMGGVGGPRGGINLQHHNTIECRIFRGTLNPIAYWANIEFLKALHEYTAAASISSVSPEGLMQFARQHAKEYPNFLDVHASTIRSIQVGG